MIPKLQKQILIPVAGYDSMSLNLSGAHGPYFTRNIVILKADNGAIGVEKFRWGKIRKLWKILKIRWQEKAGEYKNIVKNIYDTFKDRDASGREIKHLILGLQFVMTAVEAPLLDLLGKFLNVPVLTLLGEGQQRENKSTRYLFYIGDKDKLIFLIQIMMIIQMIGKVRRKEAMTPEAVKSYLKATHKRDMDLKTLN